MKAEFIAKPDLSSKGKAELAVEIGLSKAQIDVSNSLAMKRSRTNKLTETAILD